MDTVDDCKKLVGFDQQLDYVEHILQKADKYNNELAAQIDNLKTLVQSNQSLLDNLQANEMHMRTLLEDKQTADLHAEMIRHVKRLKKKVKRYDGLHGCM